VSALSYSEQSLINNLSERVRTLEARLDHLVTTMNAFRDEATSLLTEMSQANAPKERI
jgi:outer membrane murein-binding lipoprotein Lpp